MENIEKLGDFKKAVKGLVRAAVKGGVFGTDGKFVFTVDKQEGDEKTIMIDVEKGVFTVGIAAEVSTRVFNKVTPEFFEPIVAQFEKLAKVESITFKFI